MLFQQPGVGLDNLLERFTGFRRPECGKEAHPKKRDRFMVLFGFASARSESPQGIAHFVGGFVDVRRLRQIRPGHVQVRQMMEILIRDLAALERAGQFYVRHRFARAALIAASQCPRCCSAQCSSSLFTSSLPSGVMAEWR